MTPWENYRKRYSQSLQRIPKLPRFLWRVTQTSKRGLRTNMHADSAFITYSSWREVRPWNIPGGRSDIRLPYRTLWNEDGGYMKWMVLTKRKYVNLDVYLQWRQRLESTKSVWCYFRNNIAAEITVEQGEKNNFFFERVLLPSQILIENEKSRRGSNMRSWSPISILMKYTLAQVFDRQKIF